MALVALFARLAPDAAAFAARALASGPRAARGAVQTALAPSMQGVAVAVRNGGLRKENLASPASKPAGAALPELRLRVFCARAASSCPRHGRHRATEFGNRLFAQTSRAAQTLDLFQTLQAAALGFRVVLLQLSAREGVLQLPELAAAAVQARQTRRQLPLQRLLALPGAQARQMAERLDLTRSHCRSEK